MKLTQKRLKEIIKEELNESFSDDVKSFHDEVGKTQGGWKQKYSELQERENTMNSVSRLQRSIHAVVEGFKKMPVSETLGSIGKGQTVKFEKAIGILENILEDTSGWLEENK
tara:strand:- start:158 stop:493 length:336 start_codon:yes stop_codon:yes gene_type:complete